VRFDARPLLAVSVAVSVAAAAAAGCKPRPEPAPARLAASDGGAAPAGPALPAGTLLADDGFAYVLTVISAARPKEEPRATISRLLAAGPLALGEGEPPETSKAPAVWLRDPTVDELPLPKEPSPMGLSAREQKEWPRSRYQTLLLFRGPPTRALVAYGHALLMARTLAEASHGLVYDPTTDQLFSLAAWTKRADAWSDHYPDVVENVMIRDYRDDGVDFERLNTVGMIKFALPDVVVRGVTSSDRRSIANTLNLTCQTLIEGTRVAEGGKLPVSIDGIKQSAYRQRLARTVLGSPKRAATLDVARAARLDSDPDNRLVEIVFPGPANEIQVRQEALIADLFGAEDQTEEMAADDPLVAAVSRRARAEALAMKARYREHPPLKEQLLIKAPFRMNKDGRTGNEWMWVEVVSWQGKTIHGVLQNDPAHVAGLHPGARVDVDEDSVFDYQLTKPDGTKVGNETAKARGRVPATGK
jgi:uncharacterized protein YegJ (DUF2314 family)